MILRYLLVGIVIIFVVGVLTTSSYAAIDPKTCVGLWLFDEGRGDTAGDSSGNANDGTLKNEPEWVDGKFNEALSFDGVDDYVDAGNGTSLDMEDQLTITAWLNWTGTPVRPHFVSKGINGSTGSYCLVIETTGQLRLWVDNGSGWQSKATGSTNVPKNDWVFVAATYDGSMTRVYLDGAEDGSAAFSGNLRTITNPLKIGDLYNTPGGNDWFSGAIDDVAIFNVALNDSDIKTIMTQGLEQALGLSAVDLSGKLTTTWAVIKTR